MTVARPPITENAHGSAQDDASIEVWSFAADGGMRGSTVEELIGELADDTLVAWLDATGIGSQAFEALTRRLGLTVNGSRHARAVHRRPRLEPFADHALATILIPILEKRSLSTVEVQVVIPDRFLLFGHDRPLPFRDLIEERAGQHPHLIAQDSAFLLFILLDEWLHLVEAITEALDERIEDMEERAIRDTSESFLDNLIDLKELAFDLSQVVDRHHAIFDAMLNPDFPFVAGEIVEQHYRDLSRRFERRVIAIQEGRGSINNAFTIFSSSTAYRTNRIVLLLTMVSTVLLPITVIFSFFGTNFVDLPLFTTPMFMAMWAVVLGITTVIVTLFARGGMFRRA